MYPRGSRDHGGTKRVLCRRFTFIFLGLGLALPLTSSASPTALPHPLDAPPDTRVAPEHTFSERALTAFEDMWPKRTDEDYHALVVVIRDSCPSLKSCNAMLLSEKDLPKKRQCQVPGAKLKWKVPPRIKPTHKRAAAAMAKRANAGNTAGLCMVTRTPSK